MQYLVMPNRIINLGHIAIFDIYKPMSHLKDKRHQVTASDPEQKIKHTLFKGSLEECQRFMEALGKTLNTTKVPAIPVETVLEAMKPGTIENATA